MMCIFCKRDASSSRSESHILPESAGNSARLQGANVLSLPRGMVCDGCNQRRFGSKVEASFFSDDVGVMARFRAIPNKEGRHPFVNLPAGATVRVNGGASQRLKTVRTSPTVGARPVPGPGEELVETRIDMEVKLRPKHHYMSALLSKMLVEYLAHQSGRAAALAPEVDHHRLNALHASATNWLAYYRGPAANCELVQVAFRKDLMVFVVTIFGVELVMPVWLIDHDRLPEVARFTLHRPKHAHSRVRQWLEELQGRQPR